MQIETNVQRTDPCPCVGSQGLTGNGRGAAKSTRLEQTKFIACGLSRIGGLS